MRFAKLLIGGGLLALALVGIGIGLLTNQKPTTHQPQVAATIFPLGNLVSRIAGNKMKVVTLLPIGASEHTYEPSLENQRDTRNSQVLFAIGFGLDNWATKLATNQAVTVTEVNKDIKTRAADDPDEGQFDPHYWLSIAGAKIIAHNIYTKLIEIDPTNSSYYLANYDGLNSELDAALQMAKAEVVDIPHRELITFHAAFGYLADELGLKIVATIEPFPGKEPTAEYLAHVGKVIESSQVKVLFKEPQLSDSVLNSLARDYGVTIATLDPVGGVAGRDSFVTTYLYNVRTITESLKK